MPTVFVTGANRGLGLEMVRQYRQDGWQVMAACRTPAAAADLSGLVEAENLVRMDVGDPAQVTRTAQELRDRPIDILICNAGVMVPEEQTLRIEDLNGWMEAFRINSIGPFVVIRALLPSLLAGGRKVAAVISSRMGSIADNSSGGYYAYRSSKAAVNAVVKSLAVDLRDRGVTVSALHPGWVRTDMGGPSAPLAPAEAVRSLRRVIDGLSLRDSGAFLNLDGTRLPW